MESNAYITDAPPRESLADSGLSCLSCGYNLTGLTQPRCPECGIEFDWEQVRQRAANRPTIAWERAKGWRRIPAFFVTWMTVLFAPWILARQAARRIRVFPALIFGVLCFVPITLRYMYEGMDPAYFAWITAAAIYVMGQALLMTALDPHGWRQPRETSRFWLAIGGYTSAVVVTEFEKAAPLIGFDTLRQTLWSYPFELLQPDTFLEIFIANSNWVFSIQMVLWLGGLACCYWIRLRERGLSSRKRLALVVVQFFLLFHLYAFCVEVGMSRLYHWFGGRW